MVLESLCFEDQKMRQHQWTIDHSLAAGRPEGIVFRSGTYISVKRGRELVYKDEDKSKLDEHGE